MRLPFFTAALAALCFSLSATAQDQKLRVFGGKGTRAASTLLMFGEGVMAGMSITYGEPVWQDQYDGMLDGLKGKLHRLGKDWWTTFTTTTAIELGGQKIPAGAWLVGLQCDKDGNFGLTFLDATKGMQQGALPFPNQQTGEMNWKPDHVAPLTLNKGSAAEVASKMSIDIAADKADPTKGTFTIAWGKHTLTAPVVVHTKK